MKKRKADILFLIMFIHQKYLITKDLRGIIQKLVLMFCIIKIRKKNILPSFQKTTHVINIVVN